MSWFLKARMKYLHDNETLAENFLHLKACTYMYVVLGSIMKDLNLTSVYISVYGGFSDPFERKKASKWLVYLH